jgi:hypothetical protein
MSQDDAIRLDKVKDGLKNRYSGTFMVMPAQPPLFGKQVYLWLVAPSPDQARTEFMSSSSRAVPINGQGTGTERTEYVWSLIRTFVPKDIGPNAKSISVQDVLPLIENALSGGGPKLLESLDAAVAKSKTRIAAKSRS